MENLQIVLVDNQLPEKEMKKIEKIERELAELEFLKKSYTAQLLALMEQTGTKKIESAHLDITYIDETTRETFDSKRLKAENPDLYDEYVKISNVKASVRIKVK